MNPDILRLILPADNCRYMNQTTPTDDRSVILPIIILLMSENCDFFLIFSLLYILM